MKIFKHNSKINLNTINQCPINNYNIHKKTALKLTYVTIETVWKQTRTNLNQNKKKLWKKLKTRVTRSCDKGQPMWLRDMAVWLPYTPMWLFHTPVCSDRVIDCDRVKNLAPKINKTHDND